VADAHNDVHLAIVRAARSERIARAYDGLAGEMRLFLTALRPHWSLGHMAAQHEELIEQLEHVGPAALREHLRAGEDAVLRGQSDLLTRW
jgi:DNA-binding GntR family transcriptional regulator